MKKIVSVFVAATMLLSFSASSFASTTATVTQGVNFRSAPSTSSSIYSFLKVGTTLTVLEHMNSYWLKVSLNGKVGYVSTSYVKETQAPLTAPTVTASGTAPTNQMVMVTITYPDNAAKKEFRINSGAWTTYTAPLAMTTNGTVEARGTDAAGYVSTVGSYTVNNIDKIAPAAPTLIADQTAVTNQNVPVTISYPADSAVNEYRVNDGAWSAYSQSVVMTANGTVEARGTDAAGNVSTFGSYIVNNIDKIAPAAPTLKADKTAVTNQNVSVAISYPADSVLNEYRVNDGAWSVYSQSVVMTANGTVEARDTDAAGNVSTVDSYSVNNIDNIAPAAPTLKADQTAVTNQNVSVAITYPADSVLNEYRVNDGAWSAYSQSVVISANSTVEARGTDAAGNVSTVGSYTVNNIDKIAPAAPTLKANQTAVTNQNVTITITYPADSAVNEYRVNDGAWSAYSQSVVISANSTVEARGTDAAGNVSTVGSYTVNNIDKIAPAAPTLKANQTAVTNQNVTITITYPADSAVNEYRVNDGAWSAYSQSVVISANSTVEARGTDAAGNVSTFGSYSVNNIDKRTIGEKIVDTALSFQGKVTYQFGVRDIPNLILDCSSFTQYVFKLNGISIPWSSKLQGNLGTYVPKAGLQPGDLVFFSVDVPNEINHVGIYIGNGQFINNLPNKGVVISNLNSTHWTSHYITARRVVN